MLKTLFFILTTIIIVIALVFCDKKPTEPEQDNPFDPSNVSTSGDPFKLTAQVAGGGITLTWTSIDIDGLTGYIIYKSENENNGYSAIDTVNVNSTNYVDRDILNGHSYWFGVTAIDSKGNETKQTNTATVNIKTAPVFIINSGEETTPTRNVSLTILANNAQQMIISNQNDFADVDWEMYATSKNWILSTGGGLKTVFMKVKYDTSESGIVSTTISPQEVSNYTFSIDNSDTTNSLNVSLNIFAENATEMQISNDSLFAGSAWEEYAESKLWLLDFSRAQDYLAEVFIKFKNDFDMETRSISDDITLQIVSGISINNDSTYTSSRSVILNIFSENANEMVISNASDFNGSDWENYTEIKNWTLPVGAGPFTVYIQFKNSSGLVSKVYYDDIDAQPINPAILVANNNQYAAASNVQLTLTATGSNLRMKTSEDLGFSGINWQNFNSNPAFQLSTGDGLKTVYAKIINDFEIESSTVNDNIILDTTSPIAMLEISPTSGITYETNFQFDPTTSSDNQSSAGDLQFRLDYENDGIYDIGWQSLSVVNHQYSVGGGNINAKLEVQDAVGWQSDTTLNVFVNTRPAVMYTATVNVDNNHLYHFDASASSDYEDNDNLQYRWDFDGDGTWDTGYNGTNTIDYEYPILGDYNPQLEALDSQDLSGLFSNPLTVSPDIEWELTIGGDTEDSKEIAFDVIENSAGGFVLAGDQDIFGGGGDLNMWLASTSVSGVLYWQKGISHAGWDNGRALQQVGSNYYIAGYAEFGDSLDDFYMARAFSNGDKDWENSFGKNNAYEICESMEITNDNGFILAGSNMLVKTDIDGNQQWRQFFSGNSFKSVQQTTDGGFIVAGYVNNNFLLLKTDVNGNEEWQRTYGGSDTDRAEDVRQTSDGGYIITGYTQSFGAGSDDFWLVKTDAGGNQQWGETFGGASVDKAYSVRQTLDGGYILTGYTDSFGAGGEDFWLVKTDASGRTIKWDLTFGTVNTERAYKGLQTSDGGYVIAGYKNESFFYDSWIIKIH